MGYIRDQSNGRGSSKTLIGVDGCRAGWLCVAKAGKGFRAWISPSLADVLYEGGSGALIGIDIPIGLPMRGPRDCDMQARALLGRPRGSSVFPAPIRAVLQEKEHRAACDVHRRTDGRGLTMQCFNLLPKIREVDAMLKTSSALRNRVREVPPEVSYAFLNGGRPMAHKKKSAAGRKERSRIMQGVWSGLLGRLVAELPRGGYAMDDLLDALAVLWSIQRYAIGDARRFPENPVHGEFDLPMQIVA